MKILAIQPTIDTPDRYNYQVNYSLWDAIEKITEFNRCYFSPVAAALSLDILSDKFIKSHDVIFYPMNIRLKGQEKYIDKRMKGQGVPIVMFDNDDLRRKHNDPLYDGIDIIFSRMSNENGRTWLPWCVNTDLYTPVYGGEFISMPASRTEPYKLRREIAEKFKGQINLEQPKGKDYIKHLQRSKAVICTGSEECRVTRAKVLEAMACGAIPIVEKTEYLFKYLPKFYTWLFNDLAALNDIIINMNDYSIDLLKELQPVIVNLSKNHSSTIQARKVVSYIESFLNGKPDKDILHSIQNPLE